MDRRRLLAVCGAGLAGVAGCLSDSPLTTDDPTGSPTTTPEGTPGGDSDTSLTANDPVDGLTVEDVVVKEAVTYESTMGSGGVLAADDRQYVIAWVRADREVTPEQFVLLGDGRNWEAGLPDTAGAVNTAIAGRGGAPLGGTLGTDDQSSYVGFEVPSPLDDAEIRLGFEDDRDSGEWSLPESAVDRLRTAGPRFELESLSVPDEVSQGDPLSVSLTVTNVSETDGRFLAAVYWPTKRIADDDESRIVEREVAAGEEVTVDLGVDTAYTVGEAQSVTLWIDGHVSAERSVRVTNVEGA